MLRTNLWNDSVSRVVLDHRSREAHLQLERLELFMATKAPFEGSYSTNSRISAMAMLAKLI
jgi:hypothetical protein